MNTAKKWRRFWLDKLHCEDGSFAIYRKIAKKGRPLSDLPGAVGAEATS